MKTRNIILIALLSLFNMPAFAQAQKDETFTVEGYYRVKWGYQAEFLELYKKNHYPLLKKPSKKVIY
ncbi:hypothetical protein [Emticicia sp. C21]|uniref:hypothetical protein n=1 Tax=Emticicia sp. C21 TaxID=2302915 RepID=UPI000E874FC0|nr:hypothetical protein [Emticicia sp. C21]RFS14551.1 hypothetical protein D0T08_20090 [Emticicia sp. C21]